MDMRCDACTRSDVLNAGSSYSAITVTVNVASGASSPQVNQVSVSGGGSSTANASDSTTIQAATSWANGYTYQRAITIAYTPNSNQTNFPVLISGTYSYLATTGNFGNVTNPNGYDIVFTSDAAGTLPLPYERESYNASTGTVDFWVQIPTLSSTSNAVFYMFYGNSSITTDQSNPTAVWGVNFKGVWHLPNGTILSANDSTSNGNNGTINGATATTGEIAGGASFNGSNDDISIVAAGSLSAPFTIEEWAKPANLNNL
jgi:hypothetical protein